MLYMESVGTLRPRRKKPGAIIKQNWLFMSFRTTIGPGAVP